MSTELLKPEQPLARRDEPVDLLRMAVEKGADVGTLERLMVVRKELRAEAAKSAFDAALAAFQSECPIIEKRKLGAKGAYKYAPLDHIVEQVRGLILKHGFAFTVTSEIEPGWVLAKCKITHTGGHSETSDFKVPVDNKNPMMSDPQRYGGSMTFAKRYCLHPGTVTLDSHLQWRPIGDVKIGDRLIAFDEVAHLPKRRCFRVAEVLSVQRVFLPAFRLTFEDREIIASGDHRWLHGRHRNHRTLPNICEVCGLEFTSPKSAGIHRRMSHGITRLGGWMRTENLAKGSLIRNFGKPWKKDESRGAGYLAGVFDGEASLWPRTDASSGIQISFSQKAGAVLDHTQELLRERGFHTRLGKARLGCHPLLISGSYDVMRFLGSITPIRLHVRAADWIDGQGAKSKIGPESAKVLNKESIGRTELVAIETSTGTLFAEGLFSHNCFCNGFGILTADEDRDGDTARPKPPGPSTLAADDSVKKFAQQLWNLLAPVRGTEKNWIAANNWLWRQEILDGAIPESAPDLSVARFKEVIERTEKALKT